MITQYKFIETPESSERKRHHQKFVAPPLDDEFYAQSYELRKAASTMTVAAIEWFRSKITTLLESSYSPSHQDETLSILSIGSGEGDIDKITECCLWDRALVRSF